MMNVYKLSEQQSNLVEKLYSLMTEAKELGVGFVFDKTTHKMSAINGASIESIEIEEVSDYCNIDTTNMKESPITFDAHYYSDGEFLVAQ